MRFLRLTLLVLLLVTLRWHHTDAYLPVIILHGVLSNANAMTDLTSFVTKAHPGTKIYNIDGFDDTESLEGMWKQVDAFKNKMLPVFSSSPNGVHMICFSQGGLVCRAILEQTPNHNVKSFISLSSPQGGQYGDTTYFKRFLPNFTKDHLYMFFYTEEGQKISVGNYWRDPHHIKDYMEKNEFLPKLDYPSQPSYRSNFLEIEQLVLIGGPDDGVITPWQSSHFGFYNENEDIVDLQYQEYFLNDTFGLKTLNSNNKLHIHQVDGVHHVEWHGNRDVFDCCIEPYLN